MRTSDAAVSSGSQVIQRLSLPVATQASVALSAQKVVFAFNGKSGGGKSAAQEYLFRAFGVPVVPKVSDRPPRIGATGPGDPVCVSPDHFTRMACHPSFYAYEYGGFRYGFSGQDLAGLLTTCQATSVIVADHGVFHALEADLHGGARFVPCFIESAAGILWSRLRAAGYPEAEIQARVARSASIVAAYEAEPDLYQVVIDNNKDWPHFTQQLMQLARHNELRPRPAAAA